jgi:hypothetical protein
MREGLLLKRLGLGPAFELPAVRLKSQGKIEHGVSNFGR